MVTLKQFRIFYNKAIFPELVRMEYKRKRLVLLLAFSAFLLLATLVLEIKVKLAIFSFLLVIPIVGYLIFLYTRVRKFRRTFKPNVVNLILDYLNEQPNFSDLSYDATNSIPKEIFHSSGIFKTSADFFLGEDYITGQVGEMPFELCEMEVREISMASNKLRPVFRGLFISCIFNEETEGVLRFWPKDKKRLLTRSIRAAAVAGLEDVEHEILHEPFEEKFLTYALPDTYVVGLLPETLQVALESYATTYGKELYVSYFDKQIFVGVSSEKDMLEPRIFRSNQQFKLIYDFFKDIYLALLIIQDFDQLR